MTRICWMTSLLLVALGCSPDSPLEPDAIGSADPLVLWVDSLTDAETEQAVALLDDTLLALQDPRTEDALDVLEGTLTDLSALGDPDQATVLVEGLSFAPVQHRTASCAAGYNAAVSALGPVSMSRVYADAAAGANPSSGAAQDARIYAFTTESNTVLTINRAAPNVSVSAALTWNKFQAWMAADAAVREVSALITAHLLTMLYTGSSYSTQGYWEAIDAAPLLGEAEDELYECYLGL